MSDFGLMAAVFAVGFFSFIAGYHNGFNYGVKRGKAEQDEHWRNSLHLDGNWQL